MYVSQYSKSLYLYLSVYACIFFGICYYYDNLLLAWVAVISALAGCPWVEGSCAVWAYCLTFCYFYFSLFVSFSFRVVFGA